MWREEQIDDWADQYNDVEGDIVSGEQDAAILNSFEERIVSEAGLSDNDEDGEKRDLLWSLIQYKAALTKVNALRKTFESWKASK